MFDHKSVPPCQADCYAEKTYQLHRTPDRISRMAVSCYSAASVRTPPKGLRTTGFQGFHSNCRAYGRAMVTPWPSVFQLGRQSEECRLVPEACRELHPDWQAVIPVNR